MTLNGTRGYLQYGFLFGRHSCNRMAAPGRKLNELLQLANLDQDLSARHLDISFLYGFSGLRLFQLRGILMDLLDRQRDIIHIGLGAEQHAGCAEPD